MMIHGMSRIMTFRESLVQVLRLMKNEIMIENDDNRFVKDPKASISPSCTQIDFESRFGNFSLVPTYVHY